MCYCHDKRLRFSRVPVRPFLTIFVVVLFFRSFPSKWRLFVFLRNIHSSIEILKIKILEYSYPPSQHFLVTKAFNRFFFCPAGRSRCANLAEWHILPGQNPINVPIDRISPGYRQVVFLFSIINLTNRIRKRNLSTPPQLTTCHKWHRTTSHCLPTFSQNLHHEECPR